MPITLSTVYCPRCDKAFTVLGDREKAMRKMQEHLKKHPDYDPEMFDD